MATTASHTAMEQFLPDFSSQFLSDLQGLLEKAGRFTGATSAAIAFVDGEELVTKVSMGDCAPDPGSRSPISGSFTGLCVQQRDVQRCDDASKDDRVDSAACQALGIASLVIVPIAEKRNVLGVLAAFSAKANAFSPTHVALLRTIADIVIELRKRYPADPHPAGFGATVAGQSTNEPPQVESPLVHSAPDVKAPEVKPAAARIPDVKPASTSVLPTFASAPAAAEKESEPAAFAIEQPEPTMYSAAELHATLAAITMPVETKKPEKIEIPKLEPPNSEAIRIVEAQAPEKKNLGPVLVKPESKPKVEHSVDLWKREPLLIKNTVEGPDEYARLVTEEPKDDEEILSTAADIGFAPVAKEDNSAQPMFGYGYGASTGSPRGKGMPVGKIAVAVLALAVFAGAATWFFQRHSSPATPDSVQAAAPHSKPVAPESQPVPAQVTPEPISTPVPSGPGIAMVVKKTDLKLPGGKNPKTGNRSDDEGVQDQTVILTSTRGPNKAPVVETVAPPKFTAEAAGSSGMNNILSMVKPAQPEAAFRASTIAAPQLLKSVAPQFPAFARQMHIQSDRVVLNGTVNKDGSVSNIKVVRGKQVFVGPAIAAVKEWKYKPAMLNGEATPSTVEIVVNFVDR